MNFYIILHITEYYFKHFLLVFKLLEYATKVIDDYSLIHLVYTDINGNLEICLKEPIKNREVFSFNNKTDLADILGLIHGFTISVPVPILPVFCHLLLRNGKNFE